MAAPVKSWWTDITDLWKATLAFLAALWHPEKPGLKSAITNWISQLVLVAVQSATDILIAGEVALQPIVDAFAASMAANGPTLAAPVKAPIAALAADAFQTSSDNLTGLGQSTPDNAAAAASSAFAEAFGFGVSSAAVTALFESIFPEKLNTLNGVGPMLAQMAGFEEVAAEVLVPLYRNGFGRSLEYKYRQTFTPELPSREEAQLLLARGLITQDQTTALEALNGLNPAWADATEQAAYRPVQPFLLARAAEAGIIAPADLTSLLTFAGFRPADITILQNAFAELALQPYQQQYLVAAVRSTELGTMTPQELGDVMTSINLNQEQQAIVQLTVATRKLEQLAELYRKSISEGYKYGTISDAQYVPALEAIGIGEADAEAHYAVDSIQKIGLATKAALKAEAALAKQQTRAAGQAAIASFKAGTIDAAALVAALVLAGYDPVVAGYTATVQAERQLGSMTFVYGQELTRQAAALLHQQVIALSKQAAAQLITYPEALTQLAALGIPEPTRLALAAGWFASHITTSDVGTLEPV